MKKLMEIFDVYITRLFFSGECISFTDFIVILLFPIWGFLVGIGCLIGGLINYILGGLKNAKK